MPRKAADEALHPASDFGVLPRAAEAISGSKKKD